jgi:hypothetical protein
MAAPFRLVCLNIAAQINHDSSRIEVIEKNTLDWLRNPLGLPPHPTGLAVLMLRMHNADCYAARLGGLAVASLLAKREKFNWLKQLVVGVSASHTLRRRHQAILRCSNHHNDPVIIMILTQSSPPLSEPRLTRHCLAQLLAPGANPPVSSPAYRRSKSLHCRASDRYADDVHRR